MSKLIALAFSDFHLHLWEPKERTAKQILFYNHLQNLAVRSKVPILFPGDFFHKWKSIDTELFCMLYKLANFSPLYGISGNHDFKHKNSIENPSPSLFKGLCNIKPNMVCIDDMRIYNIGKTTEICGIPYLDGNIGFEGAIDNLITKLNPKLKSILMIHTDLPGAVDIGGREVDSVTNLENIYEKLSKFDLVLCGHIHKPQILSQNVIMLGAPQAQRKQDLIEQFHYWEIYDDMTLFPQPIPTQYQITWEIKEEVKKKEIKDNKGKSIKSSNSKRSIIRKYCKENEITSKDKKQALKNIIIK